MLLENNNWPVYGLEHFISCRVDNTFNLLGIWGCNNYIEDIYVYLQIHKEKTSNTIIGGDFNSNVIWDEKHKKRTHSGVVKELLSIELVSVYHTLTNTADSEEYDPTFYMYKHAHRPYHIDYFFCKKEWIQMLSIGTYKDWILYSNHVPIFLEVNPSNYAD